MSKHYAIFGAGLSAQAACRLARAKGLSVVLIDEAGEGDRASFEASDLSRFECFVFSPGFAAEHPWRILAEASGSPCLSEIAFAAYADKEGLACDDFRIEPSLRLACE